LKKKKFHNRPIDKISKLIRKYIKEKIENEIPKKNSENLLSIEDAVKFNKTCEDSKNARQRYKGEIG
jgi:predicted transcriptional regulator